jgi:uncharacterized protein YndB with AHSA1/START domain
MTEGEIRKAVVVDAPPEVVFKALTDEKELVRWMTQEARMDPRLGGECEFKYHWAKEDLRSVATGKILELIPNKRLSYTYVLTRSGSGTSGANSLFPDVTNSVVTWILDALPDGKTRVTMVHSGITKEAYGAFDGAWGYWTGQLARLGRVTAGRSK